MGDHISVEEIGRFVSGRLAAAEVRRVVRHLLTGCAECQPGIASYRRALLGQEEEGSLPEAGLDDGHAYDAAIDRAYAAVLQQVPSAKIGRFAEAVTRRREREREGWALVEALLRRSAEERFRDRAKMLELAIKAVEGVVALDPDVHGEERTADLQVRVLGELANAYRLNDDFDSAEAFLSMALEVAETRGSGDRMAVARVMDISASLRMSQRRLGEALETLGGVEQLYRTSGETHLAGRALISRGIATFYDGWPRKAVELLRQGMAEIDAERDPELATVAQHNLINALAECGEHREARRLLLEGNLWETFAAEPANLLHLRWVEGRILAGLRDFGQAERAFLEVRDGFLARDEEYDAALVGMELAGVWLEQGKTFQVQALAQEAYEVFRDLGVHPEALRAVRHFRDACRRQEATAGLVREMLTFLRQLEWHPQRRFAV